MSNFKIITSIVLINEEGEFLLGKRSMDEDVFPGLWSIPGGKVEIANMEIHILENNVKREVLEEFGIEVYIGASGTVKDAINSFKQGILKKAEAGDAYGQHAFRDRNHHEYHSNNF